MTDPAPDAPTPRRRSKWWWIAPAVATALAVTGALVAMPDERGTAVDRDSAKRAPTFSVSDLRDPDRTIDLAAFAGQPVVLNFWASWCVPCRREMSTLQAVAEARVRRRLPRHEPSGQPRRRPRSARRNRR